MFDNKHSMNTTLIQPAMYAYSSYLQELFNIQFKYILSYKNTRKIPELTISLPNPFNCYIKPKDFIKYIGVVFTIHLLDFSPFVKIDGMMRLHSIE